MEENGSGPKTITRLEIRNFKRVRAGQWELRPGLNRLTSGEKNRQGKTSILHAIRTLFEGAGAVPPVPVNTEADLSEDESFVRAWLKQGWSIERRFTEKGTYLYVTGPDGQGRKAPQRIIDNWTNRWGRETGNDGGFDPLTFYALKPENQAEILLSLSSDPELKRKLDENAEREQRIYEERTPRISEKRRLAAVKEPAGERPDPIDVSGEMKVLGKLQREQRERQDAERGLRRLEDERRQNLEAQAKARSRVRQLEEALESAREEVESSVERGEQIAEAIAGQSRALEDATDPAARIAEVTDRIERADQVQKALEPWREWERAQEKLAEETEAVERLTEELREVRKERTDLIANAEFPIEGLDFTPEGEVRLNGLPLEQASGRERIELAVMAAMESNPGLGVILIDEGNDLDQDALDWLHEMALENGLQPIVARLGLEGPGELEVVDGWGPVPEDGVGGAADYLERVRRRMRDLGR